MFKRILVPLDGSMHAVGAADIAIELCRTYGADLTLLHVTPKLDLPDNLKGYMKAEQLTRQDLLAVNAAAKRVIADVKSKAEARGIKKVKIIYREGKPARSIVAYANISRVDAIIMGSRGLSELESLLLGSVSHKVATLAKCSVMIVK
jgi:nucleotide-binding universal stress UspA family protein